jgi:hypothetical protein
MIKGSSYLKDMRHVRSKALLAYISKGNERVAGWLDELAIHCVIEVDDCQKERGVRGAMCEIGVHRGRLFILLHLLSRLDERSVGFDLFESMGELAESYGAFNRDELHNNLQQNGCELRRIALIAINSMILSAETILQHTSVPVRIFSIDGGHEADVALNDLRLASTVLAPSGVVLVDDVFNERWCGVAEATARFMLEQPNRLFPFLITGNKLFLSNSSQAAGEYRVRIENKLGGYSQGREKFFGHDVLIAWHSPMSAKAKALSALIGQDRVKRLRSKWALRAQSSGS